MKGFCCRSCHECSPGCHAPPLPAHLTVVNRDDRDVGRHAEGATPWRADFPHPAYRELVAEARARAVVRARASATL